jgi:hypothetical protein
MLSDLNAFINKKKTNPQVSMTMNSGLKVIPAADQARQPNKNSQNAAPPVY